MIEVSWVVSKAFFMWLAALFLGNLEVQIEGPYGWAENLPTWRDRMPILGRLYTLTMNGKTLTGYHFYLLSSLFILFHMPLLYEGFTLIREFEILSFYFAFCVTWDFLWFVLNPYYGVHRFKDGNVDWHTKWIAKLPIDYWTGMLGSLVLYVFPYLIQTPGKTLTASFHWFIHLSVQIVGCLLAMLYAKMFIEFKPRVGADKRT